MKMRGIKFRFWDTELKKMCFRNPLTYGFCIENVIPLQFTGLKDKNGGEIYEGDIVNFDFTNSCLAGVFTGKVLYNDKAARFEVEHERLDFLIFCTDKAEIIGNIYENPELLNL